MIKKILYSIFALSFLASCAIENDIPYPQIVGSITAFEVEGQRGPEDNEDNAAAVIDANARTVTVYVNDSVDVRELKITRLALDPRDAALLVDSALCDDAEHFPFEHFASLDSIPVSSNTRVDFSKPVNMTSGLCLEGNGGADYQEGYRCGWHDSEGDRSGYSCCYYLCK